MNKKKLFKALLKYYRQIDGTTDYGSYRDIITDLLHIAIKDKKLKKDYPSYNFIEWFNHIDGMIFQEGRTQFLEERQSTEYTRISSIPIKNLALHIHDDFEFEENETYFMKRLKNENL